MAGLVGSLVAYMAAAGAVLALVVPRIPLTLGTLKILVLTTPLRIALTLGLLYLVGRSEWHQRGVRRHCILQWSVDVPPNLANNSREYAAMPEGVPT